MVALFVMSELLRRLRFLLHRGQFERDLDEEMQHHLAMKGHQQFGNITLLKEKSRAMWTFTFWEQFIQDIRYGLRAMAANRLFTAMAVLSLALGIGANTAIYSYMDAIMLRALPVAHPEQLVIVNWRAKKQTRRLCAVFRVIPIQSKPVGKSARPIHILRTNS